MSDAEVFLQGAIYLLFICRSIEWMTWLEPEAILPNERCSSNVLPPAPADEVNCRLCFDVETFDCLLFHSVAGYT